MELIRKLVDFILHIDQHLREIVANYGLWTYAVLFLIVFAETGLVVTPFLPGDSLLFAAGALCAPTESQLNVHLIALVLFVAAVLGDTVNYWVGSRLGPAVFKREDSFSAPEKTPRSCPRIFPALWGPGNRACALRAHRSYVCTLCRWGGTHALWKVHCVQCRRWVGVGLFFHVRGIFFRDASPGAAEFQTGDPRNHRPFGATHRGGVLAFMAGALDARERFQVWVVNPSIRSGSPCPADAARRAKCVDLLICDRTRCAISAYPWA
jgi:hypothetical protein